MRVRDIVEKFGLEVVAGEAGLDNDLTAGHCGDLLSEVMGNAAAGSVWVTVQGHQNIIAVGVLREMAAIVITRGGTPDSETVEKANGEGLPLLTYDGSAFELSGKLYAEGIKSSAV